MKNLFKKLHIMPNQSEDSDVSSSSSKGGSSRGTEGLGSKLLPSRSSPTHHHHSYEPKPLSGLSWWLSSVTSRHGSSPPTSSSNAVRERSDPLDDLGGVRGNSSSGLDTVRRGLESSNVRDPDMEEEYQIQLALELSAREDPEAVQIEAVKQISLGSCLRQNTPAEVIAYRYWNYNSLGYDDKILDGFYDLYGILAESAPDMPSLVDLQGIPVSNSISWEAILVDRAADSDLQKLEQRALVMAVDSRSGSLGSVTSMLVQELAALVADKMGGPVGDPDKMLKDWSDLSIRLRASIGSMVLPLGCLTIGLARHRALLFKVLADSVGVPCRLVKGQQYTGTYDGALNIVKVDDGREYIVDLMADPGTLIPSDAAGSQMELKEPFSAVREVDGGVKSSAVKLNESDGSGAPVDHKSPRVEPSSEESSSSGLRSEESKQFSDDRPNLPNSLARSPSWTEGVSSPAVQRMKVKDVSQYMIDAAKENPKLAQKLHDVLLESGVVAPPNLFMEVYNEELPNSSVDNKNQIEDKNGTSHKGQPEVGPGQFLPPLPNHGMQLKAGGPVEVSRAGSPQNNSPVKLAKRVPGAAAAAAAAATAAVVASSMVVAVAKSSTDSNIEVPMAAAATATAAAVVATTAAVNRQYEQLESCAHGSGGASVINSEAAGNVIDKEQDGAGAAHQGTERGSDKSAGNESVKSEAALDDVAEWEISWEEITLGERIGLGSYGEVYRGDWFGTDVAVKKFLDQDITGDALEEFRSEVRIMKRLRHPNVVLFMGAVTRPPNLSIITEFLPRGSLYRLIHRPNNQLDERRRLKMALDVARGMNYLHNCTPIIVHRDLKSPNLLVDKNWVVKVCDFGLSRIKHNTFLSSRSTAGTAEWMAPEVLRNEPSDEKCDVYSFGIILWELSTLQQPWGGMNPMQVVGAVGFQHRRLDIPDDMDPILADIIIKCWQTDPKSRPSFLEIMAALKPLQKPITSTQVLRPRVSITGSAEDPKAL